MRNVFIPIIFRLIICRNSTRQAAIRAPWEKLVSHLILRFLQFLFRVRNKGEVDKLVPELALVPLALDESGGSLSNLIQLTGVDLGSSPENDQNISPRALEPS